MPGDRILIVDDEATQRELLRGFLENQGYEVLEAGDGAAALERTKKSMVDVVLLDQRMPRLGGAEAIRALKALNPELEIIVVTAFGSVAQAVEALKLGAADYLTKPLDLGHLQVVLERTLERRVLIRENRELRHKLAGGHRFEGIVAGSGAMAEVLSTVARAAPTDATVLITGESGTGKELVARALHAASRRAEGPFVAVHCGALAEGVLESELFGHEKGAFTGAHQLRLGRLEAASGGTLFLDEIGDIRPSVQVKLLRVLQEHCLERVGSNTSREIDVRVIAATHRDPQEEVHEGRFREDLYYRLAVVSIHLPSLRRRKEDIPRLIEHFLVKYGKAGTHGVTSISREAMDTLIRYGYPGNVRELENIVHSTIVLARSDTLTLADLPLAVRSVSEYSMSGAKDGSLPAQLESLERMLIADALAEAEGVQSHAAERLGISERTLRYKIDKYGMQKARA